MARTKNRFLSKKEFVIKQGEARERWLAFQDYLIDNIKNREIDPNKLIFP